MMQAIRSASLAVLVTGLALPQPAGPSLEVASVRKHVSTNAQRGGVTVSGGRVTVVGYMLSSLILEAYNLKGYQIVGGPDWMGGGGGLADSVASSPW